jgi:hypothetical protein
MTSFKVLTMKLRFLPLVFCVACGAQVETGDDDQVEPTPPVDVDGGDDQVEPAPPVDADAGDDQVEPTPLVDVDAGDDQVEPSVHVVVPLPVSTVDVEDLDTGELGDDQVEPAAEPLLDAGDDQVEPTPLVDVDAGDDQVEPAAEPLLDAGDDQVEPTAEPPSIPPELEEHQEYLAANGFAPCDALTAAVVSCCESGAAFACTANRCECEGTPDGYPSIASLCTIAPATPLRWECPR